LTVNVINQPAAIVDNVRELSKNREERRMAKVACCVFVNLQSKDETASEIKERGFVMGA
jgi:hypothetical protein